MLPVGCLAFPHPSPYLSTLGGTWESPLAKVESWVWDQSQDVLMEKEQRLLYTQTHFCHLTHLLKIVSTVTQKAGYAGAFHSGTLPALFSLPACTSNP